MAFAGVRLNPFGVIIVVCFGLFSFLYIFGLPVLYRNDKVSMRELLSVSVDLAQRGGQRVKQIADNHKLNAKSKGMTNEGQQEMLTSGDIESHRTIVSGFQKAFPGLMLISEEHENKPVDFNQISDSQKNLQEVIAAVHSDQLMSLSRLAVWVDPLDATQEYIEELYKYVTTMVCVVVNGEPTIGVVHWPFTGETVWAWVNYGHSPNLKRASDATRDSSGHRIAIVSRSHQGSVEKVAREMLGDETVIVSAGGGGYKTMQVIKGYSDAYLHVTLIKKWDICAGNAILKEAGGKMTTLKGDYITYFPQDSPENKDGLLATTHDHDVFLKNYPQR